MILSAILDMLSSFKVGSEKIWLLGGEVHYGDKVSRASIDDVRTTGGRNEISEADYHTAVFLKPKNFEAENEFRLVYRSCAPMSLTNRETPFTIESRSFLNAIVEIGP